MPRTPSNPFRALSRSVRLLLALVALALVEDVLVAQEELGGVLAVEREADARHLDRPGQLHQGGEGEGVGHDDAVDRGIELEEACRIALLTAQAPRREIDPAQVVELAARWGSPWQPGLPIH